jgi:hypothetical protein
VLCPAGLASGGFNRGYGKREGEARAVVAREREGKRAGGQRLGRATDHREVDPLVGLVCDAAERQKDLKFGRGKRR